jgi:hypothetical protein
MSCRDSRKEQLVNGMAHRKVCMSFVGQPFQSAIVSELRTK